jgi:hypothetical protein
MAGAAWVSLFRESTTAIMSVCDENDSPGHFIQPIWKATGRDALCFNQE